MPMLKEGQRVTVKYKGKMACGFVTVVGNEPISRYVVTVVTPPWEFDTFQGFVDAMVAGLRHGGCGPSVCGYVYKRRDKLEASVFGSPIQRGVAAIQ